MRDSGPQELSDMSEWQMQAEKEERERLNSAAPDMYEALKYAIRFLDPKEVDVEWLKRIKSKAEGEVK